MERKNEHYFSPSPSVKLKFFTVSESLRRHMYIFRTLTGVFSFKKIDLGTKVLIENMTLPKEPGILLDIGCGYGPIGIVLGYESPESKIFMVDINKRAIWCSKENIKINLPNGTKKFKILRGNYFEAIFKKDIKFDAIYSNPPLRRGKTEFLELLSIIPQYLTNNGFFQFVIKRKMGAAAILEHLRKEFPDKNIDIVCKKAVIGFLAVFNHKFILLLKIIM